MTSRAEAFEQSDRRLLAAIEASPDGMAAFDVQGQLLFANKRIVAAASITTAAKHIRLPAFLRCFAGCEGAGERLSSDQLPWEEIDLELLLEADVWARLSVTQKKDVFFVRLVDVSAYKHAALALQSELDHERETTAAYRSFVSILSHQLRTPLAILDSSAQRILRRGLNVSYDELEQRVQKIRTAAAQLTRLVDRVLNAAKRDAGRLELNPVSCDLNELVRDIGQRHREISAHAQIRIETPAIPVMVDCDSLLIEEVVTNLLSNAVKYSGKEPHVALKIWSDHRRAYCSITDRGVGIPSDEVHKIFDRFYRARTASGFSGTGIGLNFAQDIVRLHGGAIQVESGEARGATFTFDLALAGADSVQKAA